MSKRIALYIEGRRAKGVNVSVCYNADQIEHASADNKRGSLIIPTPIWPVVAGDVIDNAYMPVWIDNQYAICERGLKLWDWTENRDNDWAVSVQRARRLGAMKCLEHWALQSKTMMEVAEKAGLSGTSNLYQTIKSGGMTGDQFRSYIHERKLEEKALQVALQNIERDNDEFIMLSYNDAQTIKRGSGNAGSKHGEHRGGRKAKIETI
nr:MAG TPA: hypothetical protein [Caudoviricetes sp.]